MLAERSIPVLLNVLDNVPESFDRLGAAIRDNPRRSRRAHRLYVDDPLFGISVVNPGGGRGGGEWFAFGSRLTRADRRTCGDLGYRGWTAGRGGSDLVFWDGDPIEIMSAPQAVMIDGRWVDLTTANNN